MSQIQLPTNLIRKFKVATEIARIDYKTIQAKIFNRIRYLGVIWCDPMIINTSTRYFVEKEGGYLTSNSELPKEPVHKSLSGFIVNGDWDINITSIEDVKHINRTMRRYEKGLSWEDVGEIDWMMSNIERFGVQDNCKSYDDVIARCNNLDKLKQHIKKEGRFSIQKELNPRNFREQGGIGVAVNRNGEVIWFDNGAHRLAIARHLQLPEIPVCLQLIHPEAIKKGLLFKHLSSSPQFR